MVCQSCKTWNTEDEHRCNKCGRRLSGRPGPGLVYATVGATARKLEPEVSAVAVAEETAPSTEPVLAEHPAGHQATLFTTREVRRVVTIHGEDLPAPSRRRREVRSESEPAPRRQRQAVSVDQTKFEFTLPVQAPQPSRSAAEPAVVCSEPVAAVGHRAIAVVIDMSIVFMAVGLFLATFYFGGGHVVLNKQTAVCYAAVPALIFLLYKLICCIGMSDTLGTYAAGLRLVNFDGSRPTALQRSVRLGGSVVSLLAAGLGLVWALVDEEGLNWHDLMSNTFPTTRI